MISIRPTDSQTNIPPETNANGGSLKLRLNAAAPTTTPSTTNPEAELVTCAAADQEGSTFMVGDQNHNHNNTHQPPLLRNRMLNLQRGIDEIVSQPLDQQNNTEGDTLHLEESSQNRSPRSVRVAPTLDILSPAVRRTSNLLHQLPSENALRESQETLMSDEDQVRIRMITKSVLVNWMNVFVFLALESARIVVKFDCKVTILSLGCFDVFGLYNVFQKHLLNKSADGESVEEVEFRHEYNKFLTLRVVELVAFITFKLLLIARVEENVFHLNLVIISGGMLFCIITLILFSLRIQVKEYNPIFHEKLLWIFKVYVCLQSIVISLRMEDIIDEPNGIILSPTLVVLLINSLAAIRFLWSIISKISKILKNRRAPRRSLKREVIGNVWLFQQHVCLIGAGVLLALGFGSENRQEQEIFAYMALIVLLSFLWITAVYTLMQWRSINQYIYELSIAQVIERHNEFVQTEEDALVIEEGRSAKEKSKKVKTINTTEQNEFPLFFKKLTSTYFRPKERANLVKEKKGDHSPTQTIAEQGLTNRKRIQFSHSRKSHSFSDNKYTVFDEIELIESTKRENRVPEDDDHIETKSSTHQHTDGSTVFSITDHAQNKAYWQKAAQETNIKFRKLMRQSPPPRIIKKQVTPTRPLFFSPRVSPRRQLEIIHPKPQQVASKQETTTMIFDRLSSSRNEGCKSSDQTNSACVICFDNPPDSVYMPCGHGGVCYECSVDVLKKTGECYLCREAIKEILQLDIAGKKRGNNFRVVAMTTMVEESILAAVEKNLSLNRIS